jgi:hypothetical protein
VNKKKHKNFVNLGLWRWDTSALDYQKFFAELFFKKATACLTML